MQPFACECTRENSNSITWLAYTGLGRVVWETPWHEPWNAGRQYFSLWELICSWHWSDWGSVTGSWEGHFQRRARDIKPFWAARTKPETSFGEQEGLLNMYFLLLFEKRHFWYFELGYSDSYGMEWYSFSMEGWTQKCPKRGQWRPNPRCRANQWALSTESPYTFHFSFHICRKLCPCLLSEKQNSQDSIS